MHAAVKKVTEDISVRFNFNTAISSIMELVNAFHSYREKAEQNPAVLAEAARMLILLLSPFAPHIAEELWAILGEAGSVQESAWPSYDPAALVQDTVEVVVQVNGKIKAHLDISSSWQVPEMMEFSRSHADLEKWTGGKQVVKIICVPKKLINIVVK